MVMIVQHINLVLLLAKMDVVTKENAFAIKDLVVQIVVLQHDCS